MKINYYYYLDLILLLHNSWHPNHTNIYKVNFNKTTMDEQQIFAIAERNKTFFDSNFNKFEIDFPNKFVAVSGAQYIGAMDDVDSLLDLVESKGIQKSEVLIQFVPSKDSILVL